MTVQRFTATLEKSASKGVIRLPFNPDEVWGGKLRYHVTGTINGIPVRGPLMKAEDEKYYIILGPAWLRDSSLHLGIDVNVELSLEGPQTAALASDIAAALQTEPDAKAFFEGLATFYRKGYLRWLDGASRRPELRAERIAEFVQLLKAGKKQR